MTPNKTIYSEKRSKIRRKQKQAAQRVKSITQGQQDRLRGIIIGLLRQTNDKYKWTIASFPKNNWEIHLDITLGELKEMAEIVGIKE